MTLPLSSIESFIYPTLLYRAPTMCPVWHGVLEKSLFSWCVLARDGWQKIKRQTHKRHTISEGEIRAKKKLNRIYKRDHNGEGRERLDRSGRWYLS